MSDVEIDSNLPDWIKDHMTRYLATNGEDGHIWRGVPTLLLTTVGSKSGRDRTLPLIYGRHGDAYVIVASKGGAPAHPAWFTNMRANPEVQVQVKGDRFPVRVRVAEGEERAQLWAAMAKIWPDYEDYANKTDREIPVVVLEP